MTCSLAGVKENEDNLKECMEKTCSSCSCCKKSSGCLIQRKEVVFHSVNCCKVGHAGGAYKVAGAFKFVFILGKFRDFGPDGKILDVSFVVLLVFHCTCILVGKLQ